MPTVTYRPAEVLHWFGVGSRAAKQRARKRGQAALASNDILAGVKQAAGAATDLGRGAITDLITKQAEETTYQVAEDWFEVNSMTGRKRIAYQDVKEICSKQHDRFELTHTGGTLTVKPIAHLVAGRLRVPVGWLRNGMEVPYAMLIEELAVRSGIEIFPE